jgi:hypothetical protein
MQAKLFRDRTAPVTWRVECQDEDGWIEVAVFSGPNAYERAIHYAGRQYGDFEEISLPSC